MLDQVHFDINAASAQVYTVGVAVEAAARDFLAAHAYSPQFLSSQTNQEARQAMQAVLQLMRAFSDNSPCSAQEKQQAYLQFVSTLSDLAKGPSLFSSELKAKNIMDQVCNTIGEIVYQRPAIATEIRDHLDIHVKLLQATWFSKSPQLGKRQRRL